VHLNRLVDSDHQFKSLNCQVVVLARGNMKSAQKWRCDFPCKWDLYLDQERKLYKRFGLKRSLAKVWGKSTIIYYIEQVIMAESPIKTTAPYEGDDVLQLGADIIFDSKGRPQYVYLSKGPADRPEVSSILQFLKDH